MTEGAALAGESAPRAAETIPVQPAVERLLALGGSAYQLAVRVLGGHEGAGDVVQQAYLEAIAQIRKGTPPLEERTWFLRVVANRAKDHRKLEARRRKREAAVTSIDRTAAPSEGQAEMTGLLRSAMDALEDTYRVPVALCHEQGLTQREAAAVLDLPERTVSHHVREGLDRLRGALARGGYSAPPAMVIAGLGSATAPVVPVGLAAALRSLVAGSLATGPVAAGAAAAGGLPLAWKLLAGISAAAILGVGALTAWAPWRPERPLGAAAPAPVLAKAPEVTVTGKVLDQDGKPAAGVKVKLAAYDSPAAFYAADYREAVSGDDGSFSVSVPARGSVRLMRVQAPAGSGLYAAEVEGAELCPPPKGGFGSGYFEIRPGADGKMALAVKLSPGSARVGGLVTGPDGKPVAGAKVLVGNGATGTATRQGIMSLLAAGGGGHWFAGQDAIVATSGADGRYSVAVPPGVYYPAGAQGPEKSMLRGEGSGLMMWGGYSNIRRVRAGCTVEIDVRMKLGGALEIAVLDPGGKPVPGAEVRLHAPFSGSGGGAETTGPEGTVTLYGLDALAQMTPRSYTVQVAAPGNSRLATMNFKVDPPEVGKLVRREIRLPDGAIMTGGVTGEDGKPLAGLKLTAWQTDDRVGTGMPASAGARTATVGEDGRYEFRNLPAGKYSVRLGSWGDDNVMRFANGRPVSDLVDVGAGVEKVCDFVLHRAKVVVLTGRVTGPDGGAVEGAAVYNGGRRAWRGHGAGVAIPLGGANAEAAKPVAVTDKDGRYRIEGLLSGQRLGLTVEPPGERTLSEEYVGVDVDELAENRKDIKLAAGTVVKITFVDAEGKPVAGRRATVQDLKIGAMSTAAMSDPSDEKGLAVVHLHKWDRWNDGDKRQLWIFESNSPGSLAKVDVPARDDQVVEHKITCKPGSGTVPAVSFTVVDEAGKPLPGIDVALVSAAQVKQWPTMLYSKQWSSDSTEQGADAEGRVEIKDVAAGEYVAVAAFLCDDGRRMISSLPETVKVEAGKRLDLQLTARLGGTVELSVLGGDGAKLHSQVRLIDQKSGLAVGQEVGQRYMGPTALPEDHRLLRVPPGKYQVAADVLVDVPGKGKRFRPAPDLPATVVEIEPGKELKKEIKLGEGGPAKEVF